jgi:hypothetical protein
MSVKQSSNTFWTDDKTERLSRLFCVYLQYTLLNTPEEGRYIRLLLLLLLLLYVLLLYALLLFLSLSLYAVLFF